MAQPHAPTAPRLRAGPDPSWLWVLAWLMAVLAGAVWVLRPAPAYVAPPGWTHHAQTGPVLDVLTDGPELVVAGRNGLMRLHEDGTVAPITVPGFDAPPVAFAVARDRDGRLWIGHQDGVTILSDARAHTMDRLTGMPLREVRTVEIDQRGRVWIGANGGAWRLDIAPGAEPAEAGIAATRVLDGVRVLSALVDETGGAWFGTTDGLHRVPADGGARQSWSTGDGLPNRQVAALMQGGDGRVWVGTGFHEQGGTVLFEAAGRGWHPAAQPEDHHALNFRRRSVQHMRAYGCGVAQFLFALVVPGHHHQRCLDACEHGHRLGEALAHVAEVARADNQVGVAGRGDDVRGPGAGHVEIRKGKDSHLMSLSFAWISSRSTQASRLAAGLRRR